MQNKTSKQTANAPLGVSRTFERKHNIRCYDNGGATFDRYTVIYMNDPCRQAGLYDCIGMSTYPFHPQGFGQHSSAMPGKHLGKRIAFFNLPEDCQKAVRQDLGL